MVRRKARNMLNRSDDTAYDQDSLALRLVELLNGDQVIAKLKDSLFPKELTTTIDQLNDRICRLNEKLDLKDEHIKSLENRIVIRVRQHRTIFTQSEPPCVRHSGGERRQGYRQDSAGRIQRQTRHGATPAAQRPGGVTAWDERQTTARGLAGLDPSSSGLAVNASATPCIAPALG